MADFLVLRGAADPLPIKYKDMGDGSAAEVISAAVSVGGVTVDPFTPNGNVASLTAGVASGNIALPAGTVVVVTNTGAVTAFLKLSVGAGAAAVTDFALVAGAAVGLKVGSNTFLNAITSSSTAALRLAGGAGLPVGYGGGSSGGGGGGDASAANQTAVQGSKAAGTAATVSELVGAVFNSSPPTVTNGQQVALQVSAAGRLLIDAAVVSGAGDASAANQTAVIGSKAPGAAAASSELVGGVYNSSPPTLTNGQQAALQFDVNGQLKIVGSISGAGDASAANQISVQAVIGAATAPTKMNCVGGVYNSSPITLTNGQSGALQVDANGYLKVNVAAQTGVAQGSTSSGQTISPIGSRTLSATPTDTTAQTNMPVQTLGGSLVVQPYGLPDNSISGLTAAMTGTTSTAVTGVGAPGSGLFNYITTIVVGNSHATVGTFVEFQDGNGGTTFFTIPAAAVYGGAVITLPKPLKQPTANTALYVKNTTTGANVIVSVVGYKAA